MISTSSQEISPVTVINFEGLDLSVFLEFIP